MHYSRGVHHPNIVQLVGICDDEKENVFIVTEFVDGGNLNQLLQSYKVQKMNMAWSQRLKIALATAKALRYLHDKKNIMHRDLKSDNILVRRHFIICSSHQPFNTLTLAHL